MIFIALGSNLPSAYGSPEDTIKAACRAIEAHVGVRILKSSRIIVTAPVPASEQPRYRNAVISVETALGPVELLNSLHQIEQDFGRVRTQRNAPRLLDLDLLAYHDHIINENDVFIPHPRLQERGFVLYPLREIAPAWVHPALKLSVDEMIATLPEEQKVA